MKKYQINYNYPQHCSNLHPQESNSPTDNYGRGFTWLEAVKNMRYWAKQETPNEISEPYFSKRIEAGDCRFTITELTND